jgi:hypothetical protein
LAVFPRPAGVRRPGLAAFRLAITFPFLTGEERRYEAPTLP